MPTLYRKRQVFTPASPQLVQWPPIGPAQGGGGPSYSPEATDYFSRAAAAGGGIPDATKPYYDTFIKGLVADGLWNDYDALWWEAAPNAIAAGLTLNPSSFVLATVNSPDFLVNRGYMSDGSSSYLLTGFNPTTAPSPKYTQDNAHLAVGSLTNVTANTSFDMGNAPASCLNARSTSANTLRGIVNGASITNFGATVDSIGIFDIDRESSTLTTGYRNGSAAGTTSIASSAPVNAEISLLRQGPAGNYSQRRQFCASIGQHQDAAKKAAFYARAKAFGQSLGFSI